MTTQQRVLLAGATGVFGRYVTRALTGAGYSVLGLGRGSGNDLRADLNDRDAVLNAVRGVRADIAVHVATALAKPPVRHRDLTATDVLRTTGMRNFVEAAGIVGATRMVTENIVFGYGYGQHAGVLDESAPFGPPQADRHMEEHVAAMRVKEELTFGTPGIDGVSLRYGLFYGPGAIETVVDMLRKRRLPAPPSQGRVLPWVHLEDAASAVLAAIEHGRPGAAYNIADEEPVGFGDQIRAVAAAYGTPTPLAVPVGLLRPLSLLYGMLRTDLRVTSARAATELGWTPRYPTVAAGLAAMTA